MTAALTWLGIGLLIGWAMGAVHATAHLSRAGRLRPKDSLSASWQPKP